MDPFRATVDLTVLYDGRPIINGMEFRSPAVSGRPSVEIGGDDSSVTYTLVSPPGYVLINQLIMSCSLEYLTVILCECDDTGNGGS